MKRAATIENRRAYHDYFISDTLECGVSLRGNEVKSIFNGKANINEAYISVDNGNLLVNNMFVSRWETANMYDVDERRPRQLLAHKREIRHLEEVIKEKGMTLIPLKIYFTEFCKCKILVGVAKGKKVYDKREDLKHKQIEREIAREHAGY